MQGTDQIFFYCFHIRITERKKLLRLKQRFVGVFNKTKNMAERGHECEQWFGKQFVFLTLASLHILFHSSLAVVHTSFFLEGHRSWVPTNIMYTLPVALVKYTLYPTKTRE